MESRKKHISVVGSVSFQEDNIYRKYFVVLNPVGLTLLHRVFLFCFFCRQCTLKLSFTSMCWPTPFLSPIPFLVRQLPGYLAGDWWVESRSLSYILAHRFSVRDESHRLSRSFILGGIPKDTSIRFQREPSQSYLFTAFSTSLQSQTRASLLSSLCPALLLHLHRSVHQKFPPVFHIVSLLRTYLTLNREGSSHAH